MPLPILAAAGVGLASSAAQGLAGEAGKAIASAIDPAARAYRAQLNKDIRDVQRGALGLTGAEKRSMLAGTQRALQAQTASQEANLRRSAAAQGGFGRSGAQQQAIGQIGAEQREKMAQATANIDALSQRKAEQRFADIMNRIKTQRDEARQTGAAIAGGITGGVGSALAAYPELKKAYLDAQADDQLKKLQVAKARKELQDLGIKLEETE